MKLTQRQLWEIATRVYYDDDDGDGRKRALVWLDCVKDAYGQGNFVHLPMAVLTCVDYEIATPRWLAWAVAQSFSTLVAGENKGQGRHGDPLRRIADAVTDVESLLKVTQIRLWKDHLRARKLKRRKLRNDQGDDAYLIAEQQFAEEARSRVAGALITVARKKDAIHKQVGRARKKLQEASFRKFIGANFSPSLLRLLQNTGKK